jgi:hypothetical protein
MTSLSRRNASMLALAVTAHGLLALAGCGGGLEPLQKPAGSDRERESVGRRGETGPNDRATGKRRPG